MLAELNALKHLDAREFDTHLAALLKAARDAQFVIPRAQPATPSPTKKKGKK